MGFVAVAWRPIFSRSTGIVRIFRDSFGSFCAFSHAALATDQA